MRQGSGGGGNIASFLGPAMQAFGGLATVNQGASLSLLGGDIAASAYKQAGVASLAAAKYNNAISRLNFNRQADVLSRDIEGFMETQRTQAATTGFSGGSKSFLQVANDTLNIFERGVIAARNSQGQEEQARTFEGQAAEVEFQNRAAAVEYQGQVAAYNARASAASSIGSMFSKAFSGFSF